MSEQLTNSSTADFGISDEITSCIQRALAEDIGSGDVTTNSIVPPELRATADVVAKQDGVVSGLEICAAVFRMLDDTTELQFCSENGMRVEKGQVLLAINGLARAMLTGERTALNFLGRMSGIATLSRQFVEAVAGTKAVILDTRKTAPGLRSLDKVAVKHGGAQNHRHGLYDMILIKDNHIDSAGSVSEAVRRARLGAADLEIEVETRTLDDVREALSLGIKRILLDNMSNDQMRAAVALGAGRAKFEASGNVNLKTVRAIAETGVDYISVGALTHSAKVFDVSLEWRV